MSSVLYSRPELRHLAQVGMLEVQARCQKRLRGPLPCPRFGALRMASVTKCLALRTASMGVSRRTRWQRRAEEKEQPVPWAEAESRGSPADLQRYPQGRRRGSVGWAWSPAVATMWRWGCRAARCWVAASAWARV